MMSILTSPSSLLCLLFLFIYSSPSISLPSILISLYPSHHPDRGSTRQLVGSPGSDSGQTSYSTTTTTIVRSDSKSQLGTLKDVKDEDGPTQVKTPPPTDEEGKAADPASPSHSLHDSVSLPSHDVASSGDSMLDQCRRVHSRSVALLPSPYPP